MKQSFSRRQALKGVATAGAGALLNPGLGISQDGSIQVAGRPVEITLTAASPQTVRITIQPIENGQPLPIVADDILVKENWGQPAARLRTLFGSRNVKCGDLTVKISASPLTIRVEGKGGNLVQELKSVLRSIRPYGSDREAVR